MVSSPKHSKHLLLLRYPRVKQLAHPNVAKLSQLKCLMAQLIC